MRRTWVGAVTTVLVLTTGGGASATEEPDPADGGWEPVPEEYYAPVDVAACGSVVTLSSGDVREVEQRERTLSDGSRHVEVRGNQTVDLARQSDGATIDELDISGPGWDLLSADGSEDVFQWEGPSIFLPYDAVDREAFLRAGLPELFFYEEGVVLGRVVFDPATQAVVASDILSAEVDAVDLCAVLDDAAEAESGDDG
ncbi:hypothetical protein [Geodermatophilus sp. SYSU D01105]